MVKRLNGPINQWIAGLLGGAALCAGCARPVEPGPEPRSSCRVERRDIVETCSEDGILKAARILALYGEGPVAERLAGVYVREGDDVRAGDKLFAFDTTLVSRDIEARRAALESLRFRLEVLQARYSGVDLLEARQALAKAEAEDAEARRQLNVQEQMAAQGLAAGSELERLQAQAASTELAVALARRRLQELNERPRSPEIAELEAQIAGAGSELARLETLRERAVQTAPFDGRILALHDRVKDYNAEPGPVNIPFFSDVRPLIQMADIRSMRVLGFFFESDIARIRVGQRARVTAKHVPDRVFEGQVVRLGEQGSTHGQTSTLSAEVAVDNTEGLLRPGLMAEIRIIVSERKGVLALPVEYLQHAEEGPFVWRRGPAGEPLHTPVQTGVSDGRLVEIVSGLDAGDTVLME